MLSTTSYFRSKIPNIKVLIGQNELLRAIDSGAGQPQPILRMKTHSRANHD